MPSSMAQIVLLRQKRKVSAGGRGLWEALDRPMASRPLKGVSGGGEVGVGRGSAAYLIKIALSNTA